VLPLYRRLNFYSIELPDKIDFRLSDLVGRMANGKHGFMLVMEKDGLLPLQVYVTSSEEIQGILQSVFAGTDPRCKVSRIDVLRSSGYSIGLELRHAGDSARLDLSHVIHSSMRSIRPDEKLRATVQVRHISQLRSTGEAYGKVLIAFNLLFAGDEKRLREIFPPCMLRGTWNIRKAWKVRPRFSVLPV